MKKWNFSDFDSQKAVTEHKNAYSFSPIANACYIFFRKIWLRHVQTTCSNLYVMHDIIVLHNFLMAGFRKYHLKVKKWNFSDFDSQKAVTEHNNAYSFSPIANACYIFFRKICLRHVQTTCCNLYVMHHIIVLRNFLMAGFRKYH